MATQRITLAKVAGAASSAIARRFRRWAAAGQSDGLPPDTRAEVDRFAAALRSNAASPPVVYFCEWIDLWSMGDIVPGLRAPGATVARGNRFEACCHSPRVAFIAPTTTTEGKPAQEYEWLGARLQEAASAWDGLVSDSVLVVLREVLGPGVDDEEVKAALGAPPPWLGEDG